MRKLTPLLLSGLLLFAACGGDDGGGGGELSSADQEFVDAAMQQYDPEDTELTEDQARCVAESLVGAVGSERLEDLGISPESFGDDDNPFPEGLDQDEAEDVVEGINSCIDMASLFVESMSENGQLSDEAVACLADAFDQATIDEIFVTMLTEGEDALQENQELTVKLLDVFQECPEALGG